MAKILTDKSIKFLEKFIQESGLAQELAKEDKPHNTTDMLFQKMLMLVFHM